MFWHLMLLWEILNKFAYGINSKIGPKIEITAKPTIKQLNTALFIIKSCKIDGFFAEGN